MVDANMDDNEKGKQLVKSGEKVVFVDALGDLVDTFRNNPPSHENMTPESMK